MRLNGDYKEAIALLERMAQRLKVTQPPNKGRAFAINTRTANNLLQLGQITKARGLRQTQRGAAVGSAVVVA